MAPPSVPEIDRIADEYRDVRDERMGLMEKEVELRDKLTDAMKRHKLEHYKYDDYEVVMVAGDPKAKVKKAEKPKDADVE